MRRHVGVRGARGIHGRVHLVAASRSGTCRRPRRGSRGCVLSKSSRGDDHSPAIASRPRTGGRRRAMVHLRDVNDVWLPIVCLRAMPHPDLPLPGFTGLPPCARTPAAPRRSPSMTSPVVADFVAQGGLGPRCEHRIYNASGLPRTEVAGMPDAIELFVGLQPWTLTFRTIAGSSCSARRSFRRPRSPAELVRDALEHPYEFEAMRRALDSGRPRHDRTRRESAACRGDARRGARSPAVRRRATRCGDDPHAAGVTTRLDRRTARRVRRRADRDPRPDRPRRSSRTSPPPSGGRRLYLNRTLVDADFVVVLSGRDYDPLTGYAGAEAAIFPALVRRGNPRVVRGRVLDRRPDCRTG